MLVKLHTESVMRSQNIQPQLLNYFSLKKNCVGFFSHYFANPQKMFWRLVFHWVVKVWNTLISGSAFRVTLKTCSQGKKRFGVALCEKWPNMELFLVRILSDDPFSNFSMLGQFELQFLGRLGLWKYRLISDIPTIILHSSSVVWDFIL